MTKLYPCLLAAPLTLVAACSSPSAPAPAPAETAQTAPADTAPLPTPPASPETPAVTTESRIDAIEAAEKAASAKGKLAGQDIALAEWRMARNRSACAPVAFTSDTERGIPRRANFAGGWAVAFDKPDLRSAYGIAGTGLSPRDEDSAAEQRQRLVDQWPYIRELGGAVKGFAGYGIEGAAAYPASNESGRGVNSLAYVRLDGQSCTYNVWSRLGRAHLEWLLDHLAIVPH